MIRSFRPLTLLALLAACAAGCSGSTAGTVNGTVTLDGSPLPAGRVKLIPADSKGQAVDAAVTDGKFQLTAPVGDARVEFTASKPTGKKKKMYDTPDSPTVEETVELIPKQYNTQSTLKITVKGGSQDEKFELKSK